MVGELAIVRCGGARIHWRGGAGIHRRWLNWDLVVGELAPGFDGGREGGKCWRTRRWDFSVVAKLGFVSGHGAGTPRRER